jgi:hypothetical protein
MKDLLVLMAMTNPKHLFDTYIRQLDDAGIESYVERVQCFPNENCGGMFGYKVEALRRLAIRFKDYRKLVFTCAWDVMFFGSAEDVLNKIPDEGVLLAAERNCYPDPSIGSLIAGDTPWRYVNGGCMAGTPAAIEEWTYAVERQPSYLPLEPDQGQLNVLLMEGSPLARIDGRTNLFYCLAGETGELGFIAGLPYNTVCDTRPNFLHFNGRWPVDPTMELWKRNLQ